LPPRCSECSPPRPLSPRSRRVARRSRMIRGREHGGTIEAQRRVIGWARASKGHVGWLSDSRGRPVFGVGSGLNVAEGGHGGSWSSTPVRSERRVLAPILLRLGTHVLVIPHQERAGAPGALGFVITAPQWAKWNRASQLPSLCRRTHGRSSSTPPRRRRSAVKARLPSVARSRRASIQWRHSGGAVAGRCGIDVRLSST
jgi:hypothetical protein